MEIRRLLFLCIALLFALTSCSATSTARKQASYHFQMGQSHLSENNLTAALVEFSQAEALVADDPELLNYLGLTYLRKGKLEIAEQKFRRALELKPTYSDVRNNLGLVYLEMKRWDESIYQFKLVNEDIFYPDQAAAAINLALALSGKGDFQQALALLRPLVSNYPRDPRARLNLGKVYFSLEKLDLAVIEYRKAIELYPDYAFAHYSLALAYLKLKDKVAARSSFREVVRISPDAEIGQLSREYLDLTK
jgi:Tfp pilus assembly protein PilF